MEIKRVRILHKRLTKKEWQDSEKNNLRQGELGILINEYGETQEVRVGVKDRLKDGKLIGSPFSECLLISTSSLELEAVKSYTSHFNFPRPGRENCIYIAKDTNSAYRWDDDANNADGGYVSISSGTDWHEIKEIHGGNASLL